MVVAYIILSMVKTSLFSDRFAVLYAVVASMKHRF